MENLMNSGFFWIANFWTLDSLEYKLLDSGFFGL